MDTYDICYTTMRELQKKIFKIGREKKTYLVMRYGLPAFWIIPYGDKEAPVVTISVLDEKLQKEPEKAQS